MKRCLFDLELPGLVAPLLQPGVFGNLVIVGVEVPDVTNLGDQSGGEHWANPRNGGQGVGVRFTLEVGPCFSIMITLSVVVVVVALRCGRR